MKEKREALEKLNENILKLSAECAEIIPQDTENSRVTKQALLKLSTCVNDMYLKTFNEEEL